PRASYEQHIAGLTLSRMTLSSTGYTISGEPITLSGGLDNATKPTNSSLRPDSLSIEITLGTDQTWSLSQLGLADYVDTLILTAPLHLGAFNLRHVGGGNLRITGS